MSNYKTLEGCTEWQQSMCTIIEVGKQKLTHQNPKIKQTQNKTHTCTKQKQK